jgi:uncharacterized protein YmfQ (DUF2313 family)
MERQVARPDDAVHAELMAVTAKGWLFPAAGSLYAALLWPLASGLARIEASAEAMLEEVDPRTASLCLPDFERVLGPDPCGRDLSIMTTAQRQQLAHQRWIGRGGASIAYFTALAAARGVAITISENVVTCADFEVDCELVHEGEQFVWTVTLASLGESLFDAGEGEAGDLLYDITLSDIECDIRRLKPAHTEVAFRYV